MSHENLSDNLENVIFDSMRKLRGSLHNNRVDFQTINSCTVHVLYKAKRDGTQNKPDPSSQGYNARKVFSEVYASFVLQCTVSGR